MKKIIFIVIGIAVGIAVLAYVGWVNGYYSKDSRHAAGYYRFDSDNTDNTKSDDYDLGSDERDYRMDYYNPYGPGESRGTYDDPYRHDNDNNAASDSYDYDDNDGVREDQGSD